MVRFLFSSGNLLRLKEPASMGYYLANKSLFYLERYADWQSHLNIGGQWRLLEGREEFERKYA